jgi:hypothetical protein
MSKQEKHWLVCWEKKLWTSGGNNIGYTPVENIKEALDIFNKFIHQNCNVTIGAVFTSTEYEDHPAFKREEAGQ